MFTRGVIPDEAIPRARFGEVRTILRKSPLCYKVFTHMGEYLKYYHQLAFRIMLWDILAEIFKKGE